MASKLVMFFIRSEQLAYTARASEHSSGPDTVPVIAEPAPATEVRRQRSGTARADGMGAIAAGLAEDV
jgi:hypothetical protein